MKTQDMNPHHKDKNQVLSIPCDAVANLCNYCHSETVARHKYRVKAGSQYDAGRCVTSHQF